MNNDSKIMNNDSKIMNNDESWWFFCDDECHGILWISIHHHLRGRPRSFTCRELFSCPMARVPAAVRRLRPTRFISGKCSWGDKNWYKYMVIGCNKPQDENWDGKKWTSIVINPIRLESNRIDMDSIPIMWIEILCTSLRAWEPIFDK